MRIIQHPNSFRENIRGKLQTRILNEDAKEDHLLIRNLEKGIYNYCIKEAGRRKILKKWTNPLFVQLYVDKLRSIFLNLDQTEFMSQIQKGEILPQQVAFMTHQEINPAQWKEHIERKMKRDASKYNDNIQASTNMYTCRKCKSQRCTYYEMQTRSADEPATIFVTCLDCGKHWRS
jgi:DNA-directed RNA polymerase subunit M/transcription elongation factor TFIIS|tara:strand:+ start:640 stop:1167 length:528 start_codon:yes stop_codon:yes gene_type:complete